MTQPFKFKKDKTIEAVDALLTLTSHMLNILMPKDFSTEGKKQATADAWARAEQMKNIVNQYYEEHPLKRNYGAPVYNFKLEKTAELAFRKALDYAGNGAALAELCCCASTRIYEITRGVKSTVGMKLAKRIHIATKGTVKAWELNSQIDKDFNPSVDI